ncbi:hypothetical protein Pta02_75780 [Planobispora takensis]|uniref:Uncharacterized protein n=1 Tax=Planobispora takensis TaxID=1367882 RepID=A0A8J3T630_9ACTN|nr:hypothetical protein Pta02_75780 [Planobispora takensis]
MFPHDQRPAPRGRVAGPAEATRLRGRIHPAVHIAAERRHAACQSTEVSITIGIGGPGAAARVNRLPAVLVSLAVKHGWGLSQVPVAVREG